MIATLVLLFDAISAIINWTISSKHALSDYRIKMADVVNEMR